MKQLLILVLVCTNLFSSELIIHENGFTASRKLGVLKLLKNKKEYLVLTNRGTHKVSNYDVSRSLREMNNDQLINFLNADNGIIHIKQLSNGEFKLDTHVYGKGGGAGGAWLGATIGKIAVSTLGHGTIYLVASLSGPAAPFTASALEAAFGPAIESASITAALTLGLAGGIATGPM